MKISKSLLISFSVLASFLVAVLVAVLVCPTREQSASNNLALSSNDVEHYSWRYKLGDTNEDGVVNRDDIVALENLIKNGKINLMNVPNQEKTAGMLASDLNTDDWLNSIDLAILTDYLDGKITRLPVGPMAFFGDNTPIEYKTKFGDVNRDGRIDAYDLEQLKLAANNTIELDDYAYNNADVNKDRKIDEKDVEILNWYLLGKVKELPCRYIKHESWLFGLITKEEIGYDTYHTGKVNFEIKINFSDIGKSIADGAGTIADGIGKAGASIKKGCEDIYNGICDFFGGLFR